jgi:hypothetical protein
MIGEASKDEEISRGIWQINNSVFFRDGNWCHSFPSYTSPIWTLGNRLRLARSTHRMYRTCNVHHRDNPKKETTWMEVGGFSNPSCNHVSPYIVLDCISDLLFDNR